jgi:hypothetical protein
MTIVCRPKHGTAFHRHPVSFIIWWRKPYLALPNTDTRITGIFRDYNEADKLREFRHSLYRNIIMFNIQLSAVAIEKFRMIIGRKHDIFAI